MCAFGGGEWWGVRDPSAEGVRSPVRWEQVRCRGSGGALAGGVLHSHPSDLPLQVMYSQDTEATPAL